MQKNYLRAHIKLISLVVLDIELSGRACFTHFLIDPTLLKDFKYEKLKTVYEINTYVKCDSGK